MSFWWKISDESKEDIKQSGDNLTENTTVGQTPVPKDEWVDTKQVAPIVEQRPVIEPKREELPMTTKSLEELAEDRLLERFGKTRSALGPGTVIQGKLTFDTTIRIDGKLSGDVYSSKAIIVGSSGFIDANIDVAALVVVGHVKGDIKASERVEIVGGGVVEGIVDTPRLIVEPGSILNGQCKMSGRASGRRSQSSEGGRVENGKGEGSDKKGPAEPAPLSTSAALTGSVEMSEINKEATTTGALPQSPGAASMANQPPLTN